MKRFFTALLKTTAAENVKKVVTLFPNRTESTGVSCMTIHVVKAFCQKERATIPANYCEKCLEGNRDFDPNHTGNRKKKRNLCFWCRFDQADKKRLRFCPYRVCKYLVLLS